MGHQTDKVKDIARRMLGIDTLEWRKSDSLDFHDLAVWNIERALREAYMAGFDAGCGAGLDVALGDAGPVTIVEATPEVCHPIPAPPDDPTWEDRAAGFVGDYRPLAERQADPRTPKGRRAK